MLRVLNILFFLVPNLRCDYSPEELSYRRNDIATPTAHTIHAETMVSESRTKAPIMQWHVGIYDTTTKPYSLVCGGSVVQRDTVISAAHCFWEEGIGMLKAAQFLAVAGKVQREYEAHGEEYMQKSKITDIYIPARFRGLATNYADDLAVLRLGTPFEYGMAVQPVCVGLEPSLESQILHQDSAGTMLGWGLAEGDDTHYLKSVLLPFIEPHQCFSYTESDIIKWLTRDKMCAGFWGADLVTCRGDSGGGLVFNYHLQDGTNPNMVTAPYIVGVASVEQRVEGDRCRANTLGVFTQLTFHKKFIEEHIPGTVEACSQVYKYNKRTFGPVEEDEYDDEKRKEEIPDDETQEDKTPVDETPNDAPPIEPTRQPYPVATAAPLSRIQAPLPEPVVPGLQWHAAIYFKTGDEYKYVCGGSIVKRDVIISAASCFYDEKSSTILAPYVVTAGKRLKLISAPDKYAQFSIVKTVKIPKTYTGSKTNYQDNIAVVHLTASFRYTAGVQPVCVSFHTALTFWDKWRDSDGQPSSTQQQLTGWSLSGEFSPIHLESRPLLLLDPSSALHGSFFMKFITEDKICAGLWPLALALCGGDNGAGLTHHSFINNSTLVPYLFAVASTMQGLDDECKVPKYAPAIFTVIRPHKEFLRKNIQGLEEECIDVYVKFNEMNRLKMLGTWTEKSPKHAQKDLQTSISSNILKVFDVGTFTYKARVNNNNLFKDSSQPQSPEADNQAAPAVPAAVHNAALATLLRVLAGVDGTVRLASASNRTHNATQNADPSQSRSPEAVKQPVPAVLTAAENATLATSLRVRAGVNDTIQLPVAFASNRTHNATQNALFKDSSQPRSPEAENQPAPAVPAAADNATLATPLRVRAGVTGTVQLPEASASNRTHNATQNALFKDSSQPRIPEAENQTAPAVPAAAVKATLATPLLPEASASNGTYNETQNADPSRLRSPEVVKQLVPAVPAAADKARLTTPLRVHAGVNGTVQLPEASASNRTHNATQNALFEDPSQPRSPEAENQPAPAVPAAAVYATLATPLSVRASVNGIVQLPEASASNRTHNATQNALFQDSSEPRSPEAVNQPAPAVPAAAVNATLATPLLPEASASNGTYNETQNADPLRSRSPAAMNQPAPAVPPAADNATLATPLRLRAGVNGTVQLPEASASNRTHNATQNADPSRPRNPEAENQPAPAVPAAADNATLATPRRVRAGVTGTVQLPEVSASNRTHNATQNGLFKASSEPRSPEAENQPAPAVPAAAVNATLATPLRVRAGVNDGTVQLPEASASNRTHNATQNALFKDPSQPRSPEAVDQPAPAVPAAADNATLGDNAVRARRRQQHRPQNALFKDPSRPRSPEAEKQSAPAVLTAVDNATLATTLRVRADVDNGTVQLPEASASNRTHNVTQNAVKRI